jgi:hypothetical protein
LSTIEGADSGKLESQSLLERLSGIWYRFFVESSDCNEAIVRGSIALVQGVALNFGQSLSWTDWSSRGSHAWNISAKRKLFPWFQTTRLGNLQTTL